MKIVSRVLVYIFLGSRGVCIVYMPLVWGSRSRLSAFCPVSTSMVHTRTCARACTRRADTRKLTHRPVCTHTRTCHLQVKLFVGADDAASLLARLRSF